MIKKSSSQEKIKVCVLMNSFHVGANVLLNKLIDDPNIEIVGIVVKKIWTTAKKKEEQGIFSAWANWGARMGHYFLLGLVAVVLFHFLHILLLEIFLVGFLFTQRKYLKTTTRIAWERGIPLIKTSDINDLETREATKALDPDILLSNNFHQIIGPEILKIPKKGSVNVHPGIIPLYRGLLPHFWAMAEGQKKLGVTLHEIDEGIDTGDIISEKRFTLKKDQSFYAAWKKTAEASATLLGRYFYKLRFGKKIHKTQKKGDNPARPFPTEKEYQKFEKRGRSLFRFWDFFRRGKK